MIGRRAAIAWQGLRLRWYGWRFQRRTGRDILPLIDAVDAARDLRCCARAADRSYRPSCRGASWGRSGTGGSCARSASAGTRGCGCIVIPCRGFVRPETGSK